MSISDNTYISVSLTNDSEMKKLNKKHKGKDFPTDVLSFTLNAQTEDGRPYLGDVIVNKDQAQRQAKENGNTLEKEISELVAHGILHLLGVHHEEDAH